MRIALNGAYHGANFGDSLLRSLIVDALPQRLRHGLMDLGQLHWLRHAPTDGRRALAMVRAADVGVFGGGGYLNDDAPRLKLLRYTEPARWWRRLQIPYGFVGVGAGPITTKVGRRAIAQLADGARSIIVRDSASADILQQLGVGSGQLRIGVDLAFAMSAACLPARSRAYASSRIPHASGRRVIGVHLPPHGTDSATMCGAFDAIVLGLGSRARDFYWVVIADHGVRGLEAMARRCDRWGLDPICIRCADPYDLASVLGSLDVLFTSKLHTGIVAWTLGVPVFGYSLHEKTGRFFEQIGRTDRQIMAGEPVSTMSEWAHEFANGGVETDAGDVARAELLRESATGILAAMGRELEAWVSSA